MRKTNEALLKLIKECEVNNYAITYVDYTNKRALVDTNRSVPCVLTYDETTNSWG